MRNRRVVSSPCPDRFLKNISDAIIGNVILHSWREFRRSAFSAWLVLGSLLPMAGISPAAEPDDPASAILQAAIEQGAKNYQAAFQKRDAAALASLFTPEAEYVDAGGTVFHGRDAIQAEFTAMLPVIPPGNLQIRIISIRPVAKDVVMEEGLSTFRAETGETNQVHYIATHVRQADGNWLMASVRELDEPDLPAHNHLQALSWLIGDWHEDVGDHSVSTTWKWSPDGSFLVSEFRIDDQNRPELSGTQRIGWDAERKQFRSWIFESTGGVLEGWWTATQDDNWSVRLSGVDASGARVATTLKYSPDGRDGLLLVQDEQSRAGQELPSITRHLVRQPPLPEKKNSP